MNGSVRGQHASNGIRRLCSTTKKEQKSAIGQHESLGVVPCAPLRYLRPTYLPAHTHRERRRCVAELELDLILRAQIPTLGVLIFIFWFYYYYYYFYYYYFFYRSTNADMAISISFHCLGFIVLAAVFIQTITVVVSLMYLNNVLNTVSRLVACC